MSLPLFPLAVILVTFAALFLRQAWSAVVAVVRMAANGITMIRLAQLCGSRARANRLVRAVEQETRTNALYPLAASPLSTALDLSARPVVRRARLAERISPTRKLTVGSVTR